MSASNLAFVLTGSIAAYKACEAISQLVQRGHRVRVVATKSALHFVGATTLEGLTGQPVLGELFESGAALEHIELGRWADAVVVCPATAHTINRFAAGLADDFAGALFLAHDRGKPFILAPAMNPAMWRHPATIAAVDRLRGWGVRFAPVGLGRTACGDLGEGRLLEPSAIVYFIEATLARPAKKLRVLITSGPTAEPIDQVRTLSNTSTGKTGALLADHFTLAGHRVTLLRGRGSVEATVSVEEETFGSVAELDTSLGRWLAAEEFDVILHAAAVSDFTVNRIEADGQAPGRARGKLDSTRACTLHLSPAPKLVEGLRVRSRNPDVQIVAFKLTAGANEPDTAAAVKSLIERSAADWVVHNDLQARVNDEDFPADIYNADVHVAARCATRSSLAVELERLVASARPPQSESRARRQNVELPTSLLNQ